MTAPSPWEPSLATLVLDRTGDIVCGVNQEHPQAEANRALIAAAPEMRDALADVTAAFGIMLKIERLNPGENETYCAARAALAKSNLQTQ